MGFINFSFCFENTLNQNFWKWFMNWTNCCHNRLQNIKQTQHAIRMIRNFTTNNNQLLKSAIFQVSTNDCCFIIELMVSGSTFFYLLVVFNVVYSTYFLLVTQTNNKNIRNCKPSNVLHILRNRDIATKRN